MTNKRKSSNEESRVKSFLSTMGLIASTQVLVQLVAGFLDFSGSMGAGLGFVVFLLTMIALFFDRKRPSKKKIISALSLRLQAAWSAGGFILAVLIFLLGLIVRDAIEVRAEKVVFYADVLELRPITDSLPTHFARVPLNAQYTEWGTIPVYQEVIYWISYELDWHWGGRYWNMSRSSGGHVKPDILYPMEYELASKDTASSLPGMNTIAWYETIPLKGENMILLRHHHYNCFFRDNHHYGFTLRLPADEVWVVWDFSRLKESEVFNQDYKPKILLERIPFVKEDITDRSQWSKGILRAHLEDLKANDKITLDCMWAYTKISQQGFPRPLATGD